MKLFFSFDTQPNNTFRVSPQVTFNYIYVISTCKKLDVGRHVTQSGIINPATL